MLTKKAIDNEMTRSCTSREILCSLFYTTSMQTRRKFATNDDESPQFPQHILEAIMKSSRDYRTLLSFSQTNKRNHSFLRLSFYFYEKSNASKARGVVARIAQKRRACRTVEIAFTCAFAVGCVMSFAFALIALLPLAEGGEIEGGVTWMIPWLIPISALIGVEAWGGAFRWSC